MSTILKFAAALKARKGLDAGRNDPPAPTPPIPLRSPDKKGRRRPRYSAGRFEVLRLEGKLRQATSRAAKAEAALAALQDEIARVRAAAADDADRRKDELRRAIARADKAEAELAAVKKVKVVNAKVWRLNQEIKRLQRVTRQVGNAKLARVNEENKRLLQTNKKARAATTVGLKALRQKIAAVQETLLYRSKQIEELRAENERLRQQTKPAASPIGLD